MVQILWIFHSTLTGEQTAKLEMHGIKIVEMEVERFEHSNGNLQKIIFRNGTKFTIKVIYAPTPFEQHCKIPESLGCELTDDGYIQIDTFQETIVKGVYACGDNVSRMRTVANAIGMGTSAGITVSKKIILETF